MFEDIIRAAKEKGSENGVADSASAAEKAEHSGAQKRISEVPAPVAEDSSDIRISVIGVGGAGCNCIDRLTKMGIKSARTIAINTDGKHLNNASAHKKILLGKAITRGLGAGGDMNIAKKCAEADSAMLSKEIGENELVFICAGMGGGTGSGAAPVIAKLAKEQGAIVVGIVTYPFALERIRQKKAHEAIGHLTQFADTVVVIDNNRLAAYVPNLPINKAFELADSITARAVTGITDTIMFPSLINVDFADVRAVMGSGGLSVISLGEASGVNKVDAVVKDTLDHPLLDVDYEGAKGALIHIEGGPDLSLGDSIKIGEKITEKFDDEASVKVGARVLEGYTDKIRVTAIITGVKSQTILGKPFAVKGEEKPPESMLGDSRGEVAVQYL